MDGSISYGILNALKETTHKILSSKFEVNSHKSVVSAQMLQAQENMKDFNENNW